METPKYILITLVVCLANCGFSSAQTVSPFYLDYLLNKGSYDEFISILQIPNKDLVDPSQRKADLVLSFYYNGLEFGDILMRPGQILKHSDDINGIIKYSLNKWPNGTVPYYISNAFSSFNFDQREYVIREISELNCLIEPNVVFREYLPGDKDYVYIFNGGCGWYSNIGNVGGAQVISLTPPFVDGLPKHQMQHTLGFAHEQNRIDRDEYIKLHPENIGEVLKDQYIKFHADNLKNLPPYDYYSIMHYLVDIPAHDAFDVLHEDISSKKTAFFNVTDIERVRREYPLHK